MTIKTDLLFIASYDDPAHEFAFKPEELVINGVSIMNVDKIETKINHSGLLQLSFYQEGYLVAKDTVLDGVFRLDKVSSNGVHLHYKISKITNSPGRP